MKTQLNNISQLNICPIHHTDILNGRMLKIRQATTDIKRTTTDNCGTLIRCGMQRGKEQTVFNILSEILPINSWVDLRTPEEYEPQFNGYHFPASTKYLNRPIRFTPPENNLTHIVTESDYIDLYFTMSHAAWTIAQEVAELLHTGNVVLHCSLGKDRTGLVTAATLHQFQFSDINIAHDFGLSARFLRRQYQLIQDKAKRNGVPNHLQARRYELSEKTIIPVLNEWTNIIKRGRNKHD
ncbi:tyrosine-protein phosphatase [Xenorhabdus anantnagensis]|uniref:Tyrosine-protein phosphatase n=1 Tax=Xenorhabdus anantnagensis TaxID=3025875 RepID=A0ABT5LUF7_9GAMM|nr:tyrosine-protein phosphatase [Xenorhabdus anantnagensis]MDC9597408.1 tyrosine-protein phosphatase [Xenorhabdus anantnagensis]